MGSTSVRKGLREFQDAGIGLVSDQISTLRFQGRGHE